MGISFSGVGSGLPISDWIDALCGVEEEKIKTLTEKQKTLQTKQSTLNTLNSTYKSVLSATQKFSDSLHGSSSDIFSKVSVTTSDSSIVTASVTQASTPAVIKLKVSQLATATERRSYGADVLAADVFTDTSKKLSELGNVKTGSFMINGTSINVNPDMTVDQLIYTINNSSTAGVKAHVEDGQLVLQSTKLGDNDIVVQETNSNLVNLIGLTGSEPEYLTMGQKAKFSINGVEKEADTNKIGSDKTGILGLSLDLLSETDGDDPVLINISRDADADSVLSALETFVTNFNKMIVDTDTETSTEGNLHAENSLVSIRNRLRTMVTSQVSSSGVYKSLADIGVTSGAPGMDVSEDTTKLVIDKDKFYEAFTENPSAVKSLLIGDQNALEGSDTKRGLMQKLQDGLDMAIDHQNGYFTARQTSLNSEINTLNTTISKKEDYLEVYRTKLTNQFNYMDQMISKMNNQFSSMQQQLASIGVNMGDS